MLLRELILHNIKELSLAQKSQVEEIEQQARKCCDPFFLKLTIQ